MLFTPCATPCCRGRNRVSCGLESHFRYPPYRKWRGIPLVNNAQHKHFCDTRLAAGNHTWLCHTTANFFAESAVKNQSLLRTYSSQCGQGTCPCRSYRPAISCPGRLLEPRCVICGHRPQEPPGKQNEKKVADALLACPLQTRASLETSVCGSQLGE